MSVQSKAGALVAFSQVTEVCRRENDSICVCVCVTGTHPAHGLVARSVQLHYVLLQQLNRTLQGVVGLLHAFQDVLLVVVGHDRKHLCHLEKCRLLFLVGAKGKSTQ